MNRWRVGLYCLAACAAASPAGATVVTSIRITNAIPDYLQVSEVIATQFGTGNDVALASAGATATASSVFGGANTLPGNAIDGIGPSSTSLYHSGYASGADFLLVTLAQAFDLSGLTLQGRNDSFGTRDYYAYQLFNGSTVVGSGTIDARNSNHSGTVTLAAGSVPVVPGAVPEPATWAMMVAGFGMIGGALRRRKAVVSFMIARH